MEFLSFWKQGSELEYEMGTSEKDQSNHKYKGKFLRWFWHYSQILCCADSFQWVHRCVSRMQGKNGNIAFLMPACFSNLQLPFTSHPYSTISFNCMKYCQQVIKNWIWDQRDLNCCSNLAHDAIITQNNGADQHKRCIQIVVPGAILVQRCAKSS